MFSRSTSSNLFFTVFFIIVFMLFATPTPSLEVGASESARTSMSQVMDYFGNQAAVRKHASAAEGIRPAEHFPALTFLLVAMLLAAWRARPGAHLSFRPQIARRLTRLLLSPIKFTSLFV